MAVAPAPLHWMRLILLLYVACCQPLLLPAHLVMWSVSYFGDIGCEDNTFLCVPDILQAHLHATLAVMSAIGVLQAQQKEEQRGLLSQVKQTAQQDLLAAKRKAQEGMKERQQVSVTEGGSKHDEVQ